MPVKIYLSDKPNKRFVAVYPHRNIHFGSKYAYTYIDGADDITRENYRKRHEANPKEGMKYINNPYTPASLSYYILWGDSHDIFENIQAFNKKFFSNH